MLQKGYVDSLNALVNIGTLNYNIASGTEYPSGGKILANLNYDYDGTLPKACIIDLDVQNYICTRLDENLRGNSIQICNSSYINLFSFNCDDSQIDCSGKKSRLIFPAAYNEFNGISSNSYDIVYFTSDVGRIIFYFYYNNNTPLSTIRFSLNIGAVTIRANISINVYLAF